MAVKDKIISFWKQVKLRSSDMFTLFRVGIGVKVPTHKLHVKDKTDPVKVEGMTSKTLTSSDVANYNIIQADSNGVFYTTASIGGIAITEIYDRSGDLYVSSLGAGDVLISKDLKIGGSTIKFQGSTVDEVFTILTAEDATSSNKTLTLPNLTGTVATTSVAGGGTGASTFTSNAILTGNGTSAIQAESNLTYTGETLSIGNDDNGDVTIERNDHTDGAGGDFKVIAGSAGGDNTAGGSVKIYAGYGKGSGGGGDIQFISNGTSGTASTIPTPAVVAVISKEGNLQIDGGLTTGSTSFVNSSGVVQVATQGTIDHDSLANFVANEHIDWTGASAGTIHATNYTNTTYSEATGSAEGLMSIAHHDKLDGIETGATADQTKSDINGLAISTVGTIGTGVWQGTAIASNYLDSDTAHLSGVQTFIGPKTFASGIIYDGDRSTTPGDGAAIHVDSSDITDNNTSASGTATAFNHVNIENPRIMASNASVTTTTASTVYIKGAPVASTNQTITNAYALNVAAGNVKLGAGLEVGGDLDVTGNVLPGITYVKILPSDFIPDDAGRPIMIDDTGSDRWLESHSTAKMFASVQIPVGFKATHVDVYGSATSAITVYEADVNSKTVTSKGTGNIGTQINITDVTADATNYILIQLSQASGEEVYGGKLTIAKA